MKSYWMILKSIGLTAWRTHWLLHGKVTEWEAAWVKVPQGSSHTEWCGCPGLGSRGVLGTGVHTWFVFHYIMDYVCHDVDIHFELEQDSMCIHVCTDTELKLYQNISFSCFPPIVLHSHWLPFSCMSTPPPVPKAEFHQPGSSLLCL